MIPAGFEIDPTPLPDEGLAWYREQCRKLGEIIRPYLETGVDWEHLRELLNVTSKIKEDARRIYVRWPLGAVRLRRIWQEKP